MKTINYKHVVPDEFHWVARDRNGHLYAFISEPKRKYDNDEEDDMWVPDSWIGFETKVLLVDNEHTTHIKWEDDEPTIIVYEVNKMTVHVYSTLGCMPCKMTKQLLEQQGIEYDETVVDKDDEMMMNYLRARGYQQFPVVVAYEGVTWSGFQPEKIMTLKK